LAVLQINTVINHWFVRMPARVFFQDGLG